MVAAPLRILVVTRSYPAPGRLYQYPFVHRRVLAYLAAGHQVAVFRPADGDVEIFHYEGVTWHSGSTEVLRKLAERWQPDCIAVHGLSETLWPALEPLAARYPIRAWLHGSEIPSFARQKAMALPDPRARDEALRQVDRRVSFWCELFARELPHFALVFVSNASVEMMREDLGTCLDRVGYRVIANPIDTHLFTYTPKPDEQRHAILSIRPHDSPTYGNDLAVRVVLSLSERAGFERYRFRFIGDGSLFDETLGPIRRFGNVAIERRFLTQPEIAEQHRSHGIFLVPTRLDTQGVSRDEAMASGLVPVTNSVPAVLEFADQSCAVIAPPDDWTAMADAISLMAHQPELFQVRSAAAAARVRAQSGTERIIPRELALLAAAGAHPSG